MTSVPFTARIFVSMALTLASAAAAQAACRLPEDAGAALLGRKIGGFTASAEPLDALVGRLRKEHRVPLSLIRHETPTLTLALPSATLQQVLDAVVEQAPEYRYAVVREHLVLYPRGERYTEALTLPRATGPRLEIAGRQIEEIRKRYPALEDLVPPPLLGDPRHFAFQDEVTSGGTGTLVEHLADFLGRRDSLFFSAQKEKWGVMTMYFDLVEPLEALKASPETLSLAPGTSAPITVTGRPHGGTERDLTSADCGTGYVSNRPAVASVDASGRVTAVAPGSATITVTNGNHWDTVPVTIVAPEKPAREK